MTAALYHAFGEPLAIETVPDPSPPADGVVLRVLANGVCRSDWHGWMGHDPDIQSLPHVPGHELCGIVEAAGPEVRRVKPGDREPGASSRPGAVLLEQIPLQNRVVACLDLLLEYVVRYDPAQAALDVLQSELV